MPDTRPMHSLESHILRSPRSVCRACRLTGHGRSKSVITFENSSPPPLGLEHENTRNDTSEQTLQPVSAPARLQRSEGSRRAAGWFGDLLRFQLDSRVSKRAVVYLESRISRIVNCAGLRNMETRLHPAFIIYRFERLLIQTDPVAQVPKGNSTGGTADGDSRDQRRRKGR